MKCFGLTCLTWEADCRKNVSVNENDSLKRQNSFYAGEIWIMLQQKVKKHTSMVLFDILINAEH